MITDAGKLAVLRFNAGLLPQIAGSMAIGVGTATEAGTNIALNYEVARIPLVSINPDIANNQVVYRTTLQPGVVGTVYEIGLYLSGIITDDSFVLPVPGNVVTRWTNATFVTTNARASKNTAKVDVAANGTISAEIFGLSADLSSYTDFDNIAIAYAASTNVSSVKFRLGTDSTNYYEFNINTPTAGYNIFKAALSTATKVGSPTWSAINYFAVRPSATSGGAASIYFDGVRFEKVTPVVSDVLVARKVLSSPQVINTNIPTDIEYAINVAVT